MNGCLKHLVFSLLSAFLSVGLYAQTAQDLYVIGAAGNSDRIYTVTGATYYIDWTLGEPISETLNASKKQLTQGFHQRTTFPEQKSTYVFSTLDDPKNIHFSVFPNPFVANVSVQWSFSENIPLTFEVFNMDGKRIFFKRQNAIDSQLLILLENLKPSTYLLRISNLERHFFETHKIVKI